MRPAHIRFESWAVETVTAHKYIYIHTLHFKYIYFYIFLHSVGICTHICRFGKKWQISCALPCPATRPLGPARCASKPVVSVQITCSCFDEAASPLRCPRQRQGVSMANDWSTQCNQILVGGLNPSEKYESQLGWLFPIYRKIKNVPNHQPGLHLAYIWHFSTNHHESPENAHNSNTIQHMLLTELRSAISSVDRWMALTCIDMREP